MGREREECEDDCGTRKKEVEGARRAGKIPDLGGRGGGAMRRTPEHRTGRGRGKEVELLE